MHFVRALGSLLYSVRSGEALYGGFAAAPSVCVFRLKSWKVQVVMEEWGRSVVAGNSTISQRDQSFTAVLNAVTQARHACVCSSLRFQLAAAAGVAVLSCCTADGKLPDQRS